MQISGNRSPDKQIIRKMLGYGAGPEIVELVVLEEVASTSDYLLQRARFPVPGFYVCLAASQSAGKGRRSNKAWHSPNNGNLYLSVLYHGDDLQTARYGWLPLVVAVEVVTVLAGVCGTRGFGVKWPNDIYWGQGKLGGVLVESKRDRCVVGLGLNVYPPVSAACQPGFAWAALSELCAGRSGIDFFRQERLVASMILAVLRAFNRVGCEEEGALADDWRRYDLLANREVKVLTAAGEYAGVARGIDRNGRLRVEHTGGGTRVYHSGEVSVRW